MHGLSQPSILIVENNPHHRLLIEEKFRDARPKAEIAAVSTLSEATRLLPQSHWDLIVVEARLPDGEGTTLLDHVSLHQPFVAVAILTEDPVREVMPATSHQGAVEFLRKDRQTLEAFVAHAGRLIESSRRIERLLAHPRRSTPFRDRVTRAYSRLFFEEALRRETYQANRYGQPFSLLLVDVSGAQAKDHSLRRMADLLTRSVRAGDLVARMEVRQFALLLSQCPRTDAVRCAARVLARAQASFPGQAFSIGVVHYGGGGRVYPAARIVSLADEALRRARRAGGNRFVVAA